MDIDIERLFETDIGRAVYEQACRTVTELSMNEKIPCGVLVGFSGGADSVMLLCFLKQYLKGRDAKLLAVHLNHLIRGEEANRDEEFSREFCAALGVEFISVHKDVPSEAKRLSKGLEETARDIRYSVFRDLLQGRNDISCIAVAHNATDNLETVIFNMMRGAGTRGLAGIAPVRGDIIRPLIAVAKRDIVAALKGAEIPFVFDSTNAETDYTRNYIRAEILPRLSHLTENPEAQAARLSANLRSDDTYIVAEAERYLARYNNNVALLSELSELHPAVLSRIVAIMAKRGGSSGVERSHIAKIIELIKGGNGSDFSVSIPGGVSFIAARGVCYVGVYEVAFVPSYEYKLAVGRNFIPETGREIIISEAPIDNFSSKVYNFSIQQAIDFDIIKGELFVREKRDGDSYTYGKIKRKLKKLFNDKNIPIEERAKIPVICDEAGILWLPGFGVRDGGKRSAEKKLYIAVLA